jgi:hypothetical protein
MLVIDNQPFWRPLPEHGSGLWRNAQPGGGNIKTGAMNAVWKSCPIGVKKALTYWNTIILIRFACRMMTCFMTSRQSGLE